MIYAVIDTNVLVSARITKNPSSATVKVLNNMFNGTVSVSEGGHQKSAKALKLLFLPY